MTPEANQQFRKNKDVIAQGIQVKHVYMEPEEHILQCPSCQRDVEEIELKPDGICPTCLFKETP